ncbi:CD74 molecule, major histocompatibility complex, class II invariant chain b isoform X1 [Chiloscyllium punctatum]|uniref:CD74 molecule, major histocompatibility complex, class II invariant chain b isoform X1 n=1 Tax=Chiloscyllium punctatum TaxID=137246 RepID=UPI003B6370C1
MSADEQQNALLNNSQQDIASHSNVEASATVTGRSSRTCSKSVLWVGVTVLAAMLIAGQVVSVMFLLKQQDKITHLQQSTNRIEQKYASSRNPIRPKPMIHFRPMMMDMPIAYIDPNAEQPKAPKPTPAKPLTVLEQVQELLKKDNITKEIPEFNSTFSANLDLLRDSMTESEWQDFEGWLRNWLLFQLVQEKKPVPTTSAPHHEPMPEPEPQPSGQKIYSSFVMKPMMVSLPESDKAPEAKIVLSTDTECQRRHKDPVVPGAFRPSCDEMGNYESKQCWPSTGYCWCCYPNGTEILGTASRENLTCESFRKSDDLNMSGLAAMN